MRFLRRGLDRLQPLFSRGGRLEKYSALFEMVDTLLFSPADKTRGAHQRARGNSRCATRARCYRSETCNDLCGYRQHACRSLRNL